MQGDCRRWAAEKDWRSWFGTLMIEYTGAGGTERVVMLRSDFEVLNEGFRLLSEAVEADDAYLELLVANMGRSESLGPEFWEQEPKLRAEMMRTKEAAMKFLRGVGGE